MITERKLNESDFLRLYEKIKRHEEDIVLIKRQNNNLRKTVSVLQIAAMRYGTKNYNEKINDFRENRIRFLENLIKYKDKKIQNLNSLTKKLSSIISNINSFYILKKFDTLSMKEFNYKNKFLNVQRNDILLVDNPNIVSENLVDLLNGKIFVVVYRKPISSKIENSLPFIFINAKNLRLEENWYFGFVEKKDFEAEKGKINWVKKIVEDYKREKERLA